MFHITEPAVRQAVRAPGLARGSHGLDAGCGAGNHLGLLAAEIGPSGGLTALDLAEENLAFARLTYGAEGGAETGAEGGTRPGAKPPVDYVQGDIRDLPFADGSFDWVWCADTLWPGFAIADPAAVVAEFARVTKPGGKVCLLYWSGQTLLPGHPVLEARLNAAATEAMPYLAGISPEEHHLRAGGWMRRAGLKPFQAATFVAEVKAPVDPPMREALGACYAMLWGEQEGWLSASDQHDYLRLCDPGSPDFVARRPDYYAFVTYTLFWAVR
jgi:demethylmenaquinone methyltransferase/2-methoxy-6-polyprenyl-1,4-benzoquinol methylase